MGMGPQAGQLSEPLRPPGGPMPIGRKTVLLELYRELYFIKYVDKPLQQTTSPSHFGEESKGLTTGDYALPPALTCFLIEASSSPEKSKIPKLKA
jgi:hypothetical protein